jgi:hypothetical protein
MSVVTAAERTLPGGEAWLIFDPVWYCLSISDGVDSNAEVGWRVEVRLDLVKPPCPTRCEGSLTAGYQHGPTKRSRSDIEALWTYRDES